MNESGIKTAIESFSKLKVLVIGDVILDAYYRGKVERISPEAPVPVLDIHSKEYRLGGAANVALNVKDLGADCTVCSVIGQDDAGSRLKDLMQTEQLPLDGLIETSQRPTTVKTRLVSGFSQLLRMDEEVTAEVDAQDEERLLERILQLIESNQPDAIIFEDYDKGAITPKVISTVIAAAQAKSIPVTVDPKRKHFFAYAGVSLFKPNLKELKEGLGLPQLKSAPEALEDAFQQLNERMQVNAALFTLSEHGVYITDGEQSEHIPAVKRSIADVSGAGDTVIATATCALASGLGMAEIAFLSNLAGGWVCQFPGVVSIKQGDLLAETSKVLGNGH
jgi:rfaE bifunctional protein kinase chain/domain